MSSDELVDRLKRRFGMGDKPHLRLALYERLGELVEDQESGERVLHIVATVVDDAFKVKRRDAGRYFAWVVMRRLQDRGMIPVPEI